MISTSLTCSVICIDDVAVEPIKVKIYDFQLYFYETFVCDLIFFLFTSVRCDELTKNFKLFINHYHSEFVKTMKSVNCPLDDYTYVKWVLKFISVLRLFKAVTNYIRFWTECYCISLECGMKSRVRQSLNCCIRFSW